MREDVSLELQLMKQKELEQQREIEKERQGRELKEAEIARIKHEKEQMERDKRQMLEEMQK